VGGGDARRGCVPMPRRGRKLDCSDGRLACRLGGEPRAALGAPPEERADLWGIMGESSQTLMQFARAVSALGDYPAGPPEPVNVHAVIDAALAEAGETVPDTVRIERVFDPSLPPARGWPDLLGQALVAVFHNAFQAMSQDFGSLRISTRYRHDGRKLLAPETGLVALPLQITIADNGPGIPEDLVDIAVQPLVSGADGRAGVGLTAAAQIIARHGGLLDIANKRGGTTVTIDLPRYFESDGS